MANSIYEATGDGSTTDFTIPYTYLEANDVTAFVGGVSTSFTFTSDNIISFVTAPANGANVRVVRNTDVTGLNVTYSDGGALTAEQLNTSNKQLLFGVQEAIDTANEAMILDSDGKFQGQISSSNRVIKNVANPVNAQDVVTKNYLENTWLNPSDKTQLNSLNTTHLSTVATNVADVTTVANNISDVNAFAQVYRSGATDPTTSLDVGDLFYNTTSNLLKIWNGSSWETGVAGASGLLPLAGGTMTGNIAFSGSQTVDGRDVSADGAKLDLIEAAADVTDAANVNPLVDAHLNTSTAASNQVLGWTGTDYDWVDNDSGSGDLLAANNLSDLTNTTTARTNLGVAIGSDVQAHSSVLDGTTASFTTAEESKLAGIEAGATADQTGAEIKAAYEAEANAFTDAQFTKLAGIEAGATADQSDAEIRAAVEAATDSNVFTDADHSKLNAIEAGATADQTASEIRALVESATDSNVFTDADHTKLNGIEAGANVTDTTNVTAAGALMDSEVTNLAQVKAFDSSDYATAAQGTLATNALPKSGGAMTGAITTNSTFDGRDVSVDGAKLDGIEAGATADQTAAEIRTLVESATDSNVFTDADHTKLNNLSTTTTELYGENPVSATAPSVVGNNAIAIGSGSVTSADNNIAIGTNATTKNLTSNSAVPEALSMGTDSQARDYCIAIGREAYGNLGSVAIGSKTNYAGSTGATATWSGVAVGNNSTANGFGATAIGYNSYSTNGANCFGEGHASGTNATSLGVSTNSSSYGAQGHNSVAIGYASKATGSYGVAIGNRVWNTTADQISIGHGGSITGTPEKVQISESYTLPTSDGTNGQVMTTDGAGTVSFTTVSGGGGISNVVEDTTPQLGGDLDVNSKAINFGDSNGTTTNMLTFGVGGDLKIYHHATAGTYITENGTGNLNLLAGDLRLMNGAGSTTLRSQLSGIQISNSYTLPTADGTSGQVMTTDGSGTVSFTTVSGGGGADLYAANEVSVTAQPSATGDDAIAIGDGAVSSGENSIAIGFNSESTGSQNVALGAGKATGTLGSLSLGGFGSGYSQASDSWAVAIGRSLASGNTSLAMNITDNTASYGATGANSIAMGYRAKASGAKSVAISGENSLASGAKAFAAGGEYQTASGAFSVALGGSSSIASGESSYAFGVRSRATKVGQYAFGCWIDQQAGLMVLKADTTDATPKAMASNNNAAGGTNQLILPDNAAYAFHGTIVARQKASEGTACAAWKVEGLIRREGSAGTTVLVNSATTVLDNTPSWGMALSADTTNGALKIQVTGASSTNVKWTAQIHSAEITYA